MTPKRSPASPSEPSPMPLFDFAADSPESTPPSAPTQAPKRGRRPKATRETEPTPAPKSSRTAKKTSPRPTKKAAADATPQELPPNERPFAVPKNWLWTRLGDVATIYNGNSINAKEKAEKYSTKCAGLSFIATKDVGFDSVIDYENGIYIPQEQTKDFKTAPRNSALLCMEGGSAGRKVGLLEQDVCFGNKLCCFAPLFFDGRYLFNYLQGPDFFAEFKRQLAGLIGGVGTQKLKAIPIPVPPLAEIPRIVALVERLFARLDEAAEIVRETLEQIDLAKKALLAQAFRGELVERLAQEGTGADLLRQIQNEKAILTKAGKLKKEKTFPPISDEEKLFEIPEHWSWVRLSDILDVRDGTHDTPPYTLDGVPLVTSKNLVDGEIDFITAKLISYQDAEIVNTRSAVDDGDILFAMIGTIGNPVLVKKDREFCIKNLALFKAFNHSLFNMRFLLFFLQLEQEAMKKKSSGGLQAFVSLKFLRNYPFPLPPLAEQARIVALIERQTRKYDEARELAEETAARIETLKKAILARAFRGELGTTAPTDPKPFAPAPTT